jgi:hypothetical protein
MFSQVSYNVVIERFKAFADGHYLIKRFTHGQVDVTDIMKDAEYPWMHIVPVSMNPSTGSRSFSFDILFADLPRDKETKTEYQRESLSDCIRLAEDLLAEIQNGQVIFGEDVELESGATITPFMEEFTHVLTGVTLSLTMTFPWNWDACTIPADWSAGGSGSGGTGGGGASLLLKVNGVPNVVQTILDLVDGTGISINDLGDGRVELTNTGGGGGAVSWGAIVGTLSNQIDLQDALDLKADISSLGAVAFSNDYNDLDNLPTIPTLTSQLTNDSGFITSGDVPTPSLQDVTDVGNDTTNNIDFTGTAGVYYDNGARVTKGTTDAGTGGSKGVALRCSADYEFKWEAGRLYVMEQNGITIREVSHNFTFAPTINDDDSKGFVIGSRWILDNGYVYTCTDATTGSAVWILSSGYVPYTGATTDVNIGNNSFIADDGADNSEMSPTLFGVQNDAGTKYSYLDKTGLNVTDSGAGDTMNVNAGGLTFPDATIQSSAAVNSDWNASTGLAQILNKPTIPAAQIQSDWTQANTSALDFIKNKPTIPAVVGDMTKAVYDQDNDGIVDFAEALKTEVRNSTGATLRKGYIVYLSGSTGNLPNAVLGLATSDSTSAQTFGVVYEDIANNSNGYVVTLGQINTLDTRTTAAHPFTADTLVDGDVLYLSPTTAGWVTHTKPVAPNHMVYVGMVVRTSPTNGTIQYRIQNGYELDELHDVVATSPANNDVLYYDGATSLWKTKGLTKSDVGLGNVDNTSDANKPISTATQTALNNKQNTLVSGTSIKTINSTTLLGSGNISLPAQDSISLINNTAVTIGASTTSFISFCAFTTNSVEASRQIIVPITGTIKNLYVLTASTQSAGGSQVCTLRKNGANTSLTTTIGANAVAGTFSDTTNSVSVSAGDRLSLQVQNNAASGTAAQIVSVAIIIERT